jgi:hypothetical protein
MGLNPPELVIGRDPETELTGAVPDEADVILPKASTVNVERS